MLAPTLNRHERRRLTRIARGAGMDELPEVWPLVAQVEEPPEGGDWLNDVYAINKIGEIEDQVQAYAQNGTSLTDAVFLAEHWQDSYPGLYPNYLRMLLDRARLWHAGDTTLYRDIEPKGVASLPGDGFCYKNAIHVRHRLGIKYAEGLALVEITPEGHDQAQRLVVFHAWCYDPVTGGIVEPFWAEPATEYLGIVYETEQVLEAAADSGKCGMIISDRLRGFNLLTKGLLGLDYFSKGR